MKNEVCWSMRLKKTSSNVLNTGIVMRIYLKNIYACAKTFDFETVVDCIQVLLC